MRLSRQMVARLPQSVRRPPVAADAVSGGIVHLGTGAFHRAHQALYTQVANQSGGRRWSITGVSLRSRQVARQLNPQQGLYTVSVRDSHGVERRLVDTIGAVLVARDEPHAVVAAIAAPATQIVSFTVTEKGYCRDRAGQLDAALADDSSLYRFMAEAFAARRQAGLPGLTLLSCDNLSGNGAQLRRLMQQYLAHRDATLAEWFLAHCSCPSTMVDRIVPASSEADLAALSLEIGMRDEAAVFTEPFSQWVIEDRFTQDRPRWEAAGAQFTRDVEPWETAKLRMLNGAHSALAYLGLARGHEFVHQAIADAPLRALVERLMLDEAAPGIGTAPGQDLTTYARQLLERFANSALRHRLAQISMDGSQKIPPRWLATLAFHQRSGSACPAILAALGAWIAFIRGDRWPVDDPRADEFSGLWRTHGAAGVVDALFGPRGLFAAEWTASSADRAALLRHVENPGALLQ